MTRLRNKRAERLENYPASQMHRTMHSLARANDIDIDQSKKYIDCMLLKSPPRGLLTSLSAVIGLQPSLAWSLEKGGNDCISINEHGHIQYLVKSEVNEDGNHFFPFKITIEWDEWVDKLSSLPIEDLNSHNRIRNDRNNNAIYATHLRIARSAYQHQTIAGIHPLHSVILSGNATHHYKAPLRYIDTLPLESINRHLETLSKNILPANHFGTTPRLLNSERLQRVTAPTINDVRVLADQYYSNITKHRNRFKVYGDLRSLIDYLSAINKYYALFLIITAAARPFRKSFPFTTSKHQLFVQDKDSYFSEIRVVSNVLYNLIELKNSLFENLKKTARNKDKEYLSSIDSNIASTFRLNKYGDIEATPIHSLDIIKDIRISSGKSDIANNGFRHMVARHMIDKISPQAYVSLMGHHVPNLDVLDYSNQISRDDYLSEISHEISSLLLISGYRDISQ